jgi:hypothetical protein
MVAKATAWGSTINAPVNPAMISSRVLARVTRVRQRKNGSQRDQSKADLNPAEDTFEACMINLQPVAMAEVWRKLR